MLALILSLYLYIVGCLMVVAMIGDTDDSWPLYLLLVLGWPVIVPIFILVGIFSP